VTHLCSPHSLRFLPIPPLFLRELSALYLRQLGPFPPSRLFLSLQGGEGGRSLGWLNGGSPRTLTHHPHILPGIPFALALLVPSLWGSSCSEGKEGREEGGGEKGVSSAPFGRPPLRPLCGWEVREGKRKVAPKSPP
jgi:hypothetical protein